MIKKNKTSQICLKFPLLSELHHHRMQSIVKLLAPVMALSAILCFLEVLWRATLFLPPPAIFRSTTLHMNSKLS